MDAAKVLRGEMSASALEYKAPADGTVFGTRHPRPTAVAKVCGLWDFGNDKAATKKNGLTLHPYWERASNCGVRWRLVK